MGAESAGCTHLGEMLGQSEGSLNSQWDAAGAARMQEDPEKSLVWFWTQRTLPKQPPPPLHEPFQAQEGLGFGKMGGGGGSGNPQTVLGSCWKLR